MPDGRTGEYTIYRCCERWGILPPEHNNIKCWSDLNVHQQAHMLAYEQIREIEEAKDLEYVALAGMRKSIGS